MCKVSNTLTNKCMMAQLVRCSHTRAPATACNTRRYTHAVCTDITQLTCVSCMFCARAALENVANAELNNLPAAQLQDRIRQHEQYVQTVQEIQKFTSLSMDTCFKPVRECTVTCSFH